MNPTIGPTACKENQPLSLIGTLDCRLFEYVIECLFMDLTRLYWYWKDAFVMVILTRSPFTWQITSMNSPPCSLGCLQEKKSKSSGSRFLLLVWLTILLSTFKQLTRFFQVMWQYKVARFCYFTDCQVVSMLYNCLEILCICCLLNGLFNDWLKISNKVPVTF